AAVIIMLTQTAFSQQGSAPAAANPAKTESGAAKGGAAQAGDDEEPVATVKSDGTSVECKSGGDVRKLAVVPKGSGCEVEYTKAGETKSIGSAQNDKDFCPNLLEKVKARLETSGYTCN
ncbi:MAG TPA: hypothetical protein VFV50_10430, partial [Bdellovibrionales bacterium]|nr:hypothetical protein [Bdellovibrionales bacterium]